jgi:hypothetical protein
MRPAVAVLQQFGSVSKFFSGRGNPFAKSSFTGYLGRPMRTRNGFGQVGYASETDALARVRLIGLGDHTFRTRNMLERGMICAS